jgi:hypothetical protein
MEDEKKSDWQIECERLQELMGNSRDTELLKLRLENATLKRDIQKLKLQIKQTKLF